MTPCDVLLCGTWLVSYLYMLVMNIIWGQQEPEVEKSLLIKHGWHKLYLFEMLLLPVVVVWNVSCRGSIVGCLRLMDQFDLIEVTRDYQRAT